MFLNYQNARKISLFYNLSRMFNKGNLDHYFNIDADTIMRQILYREDCSVEIKVN